MKVDYKLIGERMTEANWVDADKWYGMNVIITEPVKYIGDYLEGSNRELNTMPVSTAYWGINLEGETKMDKEQIEQFKKEELFLVAGKNACGISNSLTTKNNIPYYIKEGYRVFRLDSLKEVTKAEVVVE